MKIKNSKTENSNTGVKGIQRRADRGNIFEVSVSVPRKKTYATRVFIGNYPTLKEAKKARKEFILALF